MSKVVDDSTETCGMNIKCNSNKQVDADLL